MNHKFDEVTRSLAQAVTRRAALRKFSVGLASIALACIGLANQAAADPTFTPIDYPGESGTLALDINVSGQIVGRYIDSAGLHRGFLLSAGVFTPIDVPNSVYTPPLGINANMLSNLHGLLLSAGVYTSIDFPGSTGTLAFGINDGGAIVGCYLDPSTGIHGFLRTP